MVSFDSPEKIRKPLGTRSGSFLFNLSFKETTLDKTLKARDFVCLLYSCDLNAETYRKL